LINVLWIAAQFANPPILRLTYNMVHISLLIGLVWHQPKQEFSLTPIRK